ncbi:O-antigen ligase family protein [Aeribacillus sp. FSL K6-2848]|uniref:O-antigen ligase family protein n=1 Tax=Aeribacillus sp. FSL K6-2848 TaxID=2954612 RepID=UPI0030F8D10D
MNLAYQNIEQKKWFIFIIIILGAILGIVASNGILLISFFTLLLLMFLFYLFVYNRNLFILIFAVNYFYTFELNINIQFNRNIDILSLVFILFMGIRSDIILRNYKNLKFLYLLALSSLLILFSSSLFSHEILNSFRGTYEVLVFYLFIIYVFDSFKNLHDIELFISKLFLVFIICLVANWGLRFLYPNLTLNKNVYGFILDLIIPLGFVLLQYKKNLKIFLFLLLSIITLLFNDSRGSLLAVVISIFLYLILYKRNIIKIFRYALVGLFISVISFFVLPDTIITRLTDIDDKNDFNTITRIDMWEASRDLFVNHPYIGIGLRNFNYYYNSFYNDFPYFNPFHPHNTYLYILSGTGIIGSLVFLIGVVVFGFIIIRCRKKSSDYLGAFVTGVLVSLVALLIHGMVDTYIIYISVMLMVSLYIGLVLKIYQFSK